MNISYRLLELNRRVEITAEDFKSSMLYRDFQNILKEHNCELLFRDSVIVGPGIFLEVKISVLPIEH